MTKAEQQQRQEWEKRIAECPSQWTEREEMVCGQRCEAGMIAVLAML